jgi:hypothetical protein
VARIKKLFVIISLLALPFLLQCGGGEDDDGQSAKHFPGQDEDEEAAFFAAPTEYGYLLSVIEEEGERYLVLDYEYYDGEVLRLPAESEEPVAFNYWNGFLYYGVMIEGSVAEGGVCSVEMYDEGSAEKHILCVVETGPADRLYGQVIAAAGLVFIAAEIDHGGVKELVIYCFDIETGEDLAEWTGVGEDIEFAGGCGTATPDTVFFQIREGREYTLYTRNGRAFEDVHSGLYGRFDPDAGYWLFAEEVVPREGFAQKLEEGGVKPDSVFPVRTGESVLPAFPLYYSYDLRSGEISSLLLSRDVNGEAAEGLIDGDVATVWIVDAAEKAEVRIGFGAPLRVGSMYILPCYPDPDEFGMYDRVKRIRAEASSGFYAEIEFPDELRFQEIPLAGEGEKPPIINWAAFTILEVYEGENGETCVAEISFSVR